ncbi:MAG: hypothetical protein HYX72_04960 [Acidobacteria bacterium]|nr:hypothetical protein [Acidobacteriota bacterium]
MEHFTLEDWLDYARVKEHAEHRELMQQHLNEGCMPCARAVEIWKKVAEVASHEISYAPPESVVRCVKAVYYLYEPEKALFGVINIARVVFDSFRQPALEGVRGTTVSMRQILFKRGDIFVDVRIEAQTGPDQIVIIGQIADPASQAMSFSDIPIVAVSGRETLARTVTNDLGEFRLEFSPADEVQVIVNFEGSKFLFLPLPPLSSATERPTFITGRWLSNH